MDADDVRANANRATTPRRKGRLASRRESARIFCGFVRVRRVESSHEYLDFEAGWRSSGADGRGLRWTGGGGR